MTQALALFYRQLAIPLGAGGDDYRDGQRLGSAGRYAQPRPGRSSLPASRAAHLLWEDSPRHRRDTEPRPLRRHHNKPFDNVGKETPLPLGGGGIAQID